MIHLSKSTIPRMLDLMESMQRQAVIDSDLEKLLDHPDYQMELERYGNHFPESRFTREEFIHFFKNIRTLKPEEIPQRQLKLRQESLLAIMDDIPHYREVYNRFKDFSEEDVRTAMKMTNAGLPDGVHLEDIHIVFNIGLGASGGYAYKNYSQYDLKLILEDQTIESMMNTVLQTNWQQVY